MSSFLGILNSLKLTNDLAQNWETIVPTSFYYDHLSEQEITEINVAIYAFYYKLGFLGEYKENLTSVNTFNYKKSPLKFSMTLKILDVV